MQHTSILMSSFGALLILLSVNENMLKSNDVVSKPNTTETPVGIMPVTIEAPSATAHPVTDNTADFNYLKFDVSDFEKEETGNNEMPEETDFSYLKFNVSDYIGNEGSILPVESDFGYLKFDVNDYITIPYNDEELPSTDLGYLKFDVQKYLPNDSIAEITELPEE
jgi:hypothetical protein